MIHHYNHETLVVLVLFTVPFYHFSFSRYLELAECHFSSDILVPFPDSGVLYSCVSRKCRISLTDKWGPHGPHLKQKQFFSDIIKPDLKLSKPFYLNKISYVLPELWMFFYIMWCFFAKKSFPAILKAVVGYCNCRIN